MDLHKLNCLGEGESNVTTDRFRFIQPIRIDYLMALERWCWDETVCASDAFVSITKTNSI